MRYKAPSRISQTVGGVGKEVVKSIKTKGREISRYTDEGLSDDRSDMPNKHQYIDVYLLAQT